MFFFVSTISTRGDNSPKGVVSRPVYDHWKIIQDNRSTNPLRIRLRRHRGGRDKAHRRDIHQLLRRLVALATAQGTTSLTPVEIASALESYPSSAVIHTDAGPQLRILTGASRSMERAWPSDDVLLYTSLVDFRQIIASYSAEDRSLMTTRRRLPQKGDLERSAIIVVIPHYHL